MKTLTPVAPDIPLLDSVVFAEKQHPYIPLPASRTAEGEVVTRWRPNWAARLALLFGADIYLTLLTFNRPLTPVKVSVERPVYVLFPKVGE